MDKLVLVAIGCLAVSASWFVRNGHEGPALLAVSAIAVGAAIQLIAAGISQLRKR